MCEKVRLLSILVSLALLASASPAFAAHDDLELEFDGLEASVTDHGQLRLKYEIDGDDWAEVEDHGVTPTLVIYMKSDGGGELGYAYSFELASRAGSFTLPDEYDPYELELFQVAVRGYDRSWRIGAIEAQGASGPRLIFVRDGRLFRVGALSASESPAVVDRVEFEEEDSDEHDHGDHSEDEERHGDGERHVHTSKQTWHHESGSAEVTVTTSTSSSEEHHGGEDHHADEQAGEQEEDEQARDPQWKAGVIAACNEHTRYDSDMETCTKYALKVEPEWAEETVVACDEHNRYRSDFRHCIEVAVKYDDQNPAEVMETCDESNRYRSDTKKCVKFGAAYSSDPTPIIEACESAADFRSDQMACIRLGAKLGEGGAAIVRACSGRELEECIERAAE